MSQPLIIAEAGVNHNGQTDLAFALVEAAAKAGADVVKFQTFKAELLVTADAPKAEYQQRATGAGESQYAMLKRLELSPDLHHELKREAERLGLEFLSTAFDSQSLRFLVDEVGLKRLKLPSGELTNAPFVLEHARTGAELIVSTGMANLAEIEQALGVIAFGRIAGADDRPSVDAFKAAYASAEGQAALKSGVTLMHCTSDYPAAPQAINLRAMDTLSAAFGLPVGYSDHTLGTAMSIAAVARGARIVEKHFTLDRTLEGPDHAASLEPDELTQMIRGIRDVSAALGDGIKRPQPAELSTARVARKSLVARVPIRAGEPFTTDNLTVMRPGTGLSPIGYWALLGKTARQDYPAGSLIVD
ncbi:N-acetylneuraminate synthase [Halothiobacillus neapolitanus]|uniref:N-acetylneuraminate synthase n=1 Tax=Halothiobacillus neapolitanus (strain ATCC 23641 / DSM 15147 / CIP 104769 / NCIMB 8539 / c2) TaxID=555778 RepID=D0KYG1_HALNC|nr:N-acetylneuraminate synthase [Halothiobacillus neapolitanus]ACX95484.1 N-acetylneuraminate synthase [Halothiobacillus neapolitanus c2]TDN65781.1 N-acetylneuraminate synthase [Halothiobacillus neapolitanus]